MIIIFSSRANREKYGIIPGFIPCGIGLNDGNCDDLTIRIHAIDMETGIPIAKEKKHYEF